MNDAVGARHDWKGTWISPVPWALFIVALAVRLLYVMTTVPVPFAAGSPVDSAEYDALGLRLAQGHGYVDAHGHPTALRPPGYPVFLAAVYRVAGHDLMAVRIVQAFLGAGICLLVYVIARRCFGQAVAVASSLGCGLYLPLVVSTSDIMTELLFTFLLLSGISILFTGKGSLALLISGGLFGWALLTRPMLLFFIPLLGLWVGLRDRQTPFRSIALIGAGLLLVMMPWSIRNYDRFHAVVPLSTIGGWALYNSYVPAEKGFGYNSLSQVGEEYVHLTDEVQRNRYLVRKTVEYVTSHPWTVLHLTVTKVALFVYPFDGYWYPVSFGSKYNIFWGLVWCLSLPAIIRDRPRHGGEPIALLYFLFASFFVGVVVFYGSPRFRLPLEPVLVCFAAQGAAYVARCHRIALLLALVLNMSLFLFFRGDEHKALFEWLRSWM